MKTDHPVRFRRAVVRLGTASLGLFLATLAPAQPVNWIGAADNGVWSTAANWSGGAVPNSSSDVVFAGALNPNSAGLISTNLTTSISVNSVTFDNAAGLAADVRLRGRGGMLTFGAGDRTIISVINGGNVTINGSNNTTGTITLNLNYSGFATIHVGAGSDLSTTGNGTFITGTGGLIKTGEGTIRVGPTSTSANNTSSTFSGGFELKEGVVLIAFNGAFASGASTGFGTGTLTLSGGTVGSTTNNPKTIGNNVTLNGTVNMTQASGVSTAALFVVPNNAGSTTTLARDSALRVEQTLTWNQVIGGSHNLEKLGGGTLILNAANTYAGLTRVTEGTLELNGSIAGNLEVASGGSLAGRGSVGGHAIIAGLHSPGNSPGIQHFNGDLTYSAGAGVLWELDANTSTQGSPTAVFDQVMVGGTLDFAGATLLSLSFNGAGSTVNWNDAFWQFSRSWTIYDAAAVSGFSNLSLAPTNWLDGSGNEFNSILGGWQFTLAQVGNDIQLHYAAIPEPSTYAAVLGALAAAIVTLRRRRRVAV